MVIYSLHAGDSTRGVPPALNDEIIVRLLVRFLLSFDRVFTCFQYEILTRTESRALMMT